MKGRSLAREIALQALFQTDLVVDMPLERALTAASSEHDVIEAKIAIEYATSLAKGVMDYRKEIDDMIISNMEGWSLERIGNIERNILRLCLYEIRFADEPIAPAVAINEAVNLGKLYCDDNGPKFINGIMGKFMRNTQGQNK